jgi:hypothetical protein
MRMVARTLELGPLDALEIEHLLKCSAAAVRKYMGELIHVGAARALPRESPSERTVFMLVDAAKAKAHLDEIDQTLPSKRPPVAKPQRYTGAIRVSDGVSVSIEPAAHARPRDPLMDALFGRAPTLEAP